MFFALIKKLTFIFDVGRKMVENLLSPTLDGEDKIKFMKFINSYIIINNKKNNNL